MVMVHGINQFGEEHLKMRTLCLRLCVYVCVYVCVCVFACAFVCAYVLYNCSGKALCMCCCVDRYVM